MNYRLGLCSLVFAAATFADLDTVLREANLEKRSEKAMKNAHGALDRARDAYKKGDAAAEAAALDEVRQSIELAKKSLDDSGKDPRRNSKYFKKAEIELRKLIRRLDEFMIEKSVDDRQPVEQILRLGHRIHEALIAGIMGNRPTRR
jgi:chemotaxis regulatin CheY-phosphate phosphatase CheZ